jgi:hypothetical protein
VRSLPVDKTSVTLGPNAVRPYRAAWDTRKRFSFLGLFPDPVPDVPRQTVRFGHVNQSSRGRTLCPSWECRIAPWRTASHFPRARLLAPARDFPFPILDFRLVAPDVPRASCPRRAWPGWPWHAVRSFRFFSPLHCIGAKDLELRSGAKKANGRIRRPITGLDSLQEQDENGSDPLCVYLTD